MKAGSAYLRFEITPTAPNNVDFSGPSNSASNVLKTMSLNVGGLMVESINDYNQYYQIIQTNATNANYVERDCSITETGVGLVAAATRTFSVPVLSGLFNQENHLPLFLINSNINLQFNLASAAEAFTGAAAATAYLIENPTLVYEKIHTDQEFENAVRGKLSEGSVYELPFYSALSYRTAVAGQGTFNQNIGVNLSSLSSVLYVHVTNPSDGTSNKYFIRNNGASKGSGSNRTIRADGETLVQSQLYSDAQTFMECQRALGSILDVAQTTVANGTNWSTRYHVNGQSAQRFSDADLCMSGRACNTINIVEEDCSGPATIFIYLIYNAVLMVSADGSCIVSK
jgi:hypothetical protein